MDFVLARNPPSDAARLRIRNLVHFFLETGTNDNYAKLSFDNYGETFSEFLLGEQVIPSGYNQFVQALGQGLDYRFKHIVQEISYDRNQVRVQTDQGMFTGMKAVITLPHAVLKRGDVQFTPSLPSGKVHAINRLGTGMTDKYWFRFSKAFWIDSPDFIGRISRLPIKWPSWYNMHKYTGEPVLVGFNTQGYARKLAESSDTEVVDEAMAVLRGLYGGRIPDPEGMIRSSWGTERFSGYGAVSYLPVGATNGDRALLRKTVMDALYFAGEATSSDFPTLVLGAYQTGQIATRNIVAQLTV